MAKEEPTGEVALSRPNGILIPPRNDKLAARAGHKGRPMYGDLYDALNDEKDLEERL